jgi:hypothetical protein
MQKIPIKITWRGLVEIISIGLLSCCHFKNMSMSITFGFGPAKIAQISWIYRSAESLQVFIGVVCIFSVGCQRCAGIAGMRYLLDIGKLSKVGKFLRYFICKLIEK